ncbi:Hsk1-interacting molecule 1, partial [Grifola frondosa]
RIIPPYLSAPHQTTLRRTPGSKRPHSPDPAVDERLPQSAKRLKSNPAPTMSREELRKERGRKRAEREEEFRIKYSRAFPNWTFYFDMDTANPEVAALRTKLEKRVSQMGAHVEDFFSKDITHLITLLEDADKENISKKPSVNPSGVLGSPIRLKGRASNSGVPADHLVKKAIAFNMKVWSASKLTNVLDRCQVPATTTTAPPAPATTLAKERSLTRLLESERLHGTTERDPTQRRHDYAYFSKGTYFVLVEDMKQELATISALEYPVVKGRDGKEKGPWPVLYCHPLARGPFIEYDEVEERRRDKAERAEKEREAELRRRKAKLRQQEERRLARVRMHAKQHDLRRSVSMNNLHRRATFPGAGPEGFVDLDADFGDADTMESANASGYLASGAYMAASGNSVSITSATGTTSTVGSQPFRSLQLPTGLRERLQQQVVTSRKFSTNSAVEDKENRMGPPLLIPERTRLLRKSRSTNTLRLPRREEGAKPGYCESCRQKFEDFQEHVNGRRHQKFAANNVNFAQLDYILSRVRRRTLAEVAEEEKLRESARIQDSMQQPDELDLFLQSSEDNMMLPAHDAAVSEDVQWDEWVDADGM